MSAEWGRGWRVGPKRWDSLRSLHCLLAGHRWKVNARKTQRRCARCWMVQDRPAPECPGICIAHIDCDSHTPGCTYPEPHIHGFACDKTCAHCHGRGIPVTDPENHPNHEQWRSRA